MNTTFTTPPLTPKIITILKQLDINNIDDLRHQGVITTFLLIKATCTGITDSLLWQLIGLLENRPAQSLTDEEKRHWKNCVQQHPPVAQFPPLQTMQRWMRHALKCAQQAMNQHEIPVGAVVVYQNTIIGSGYNHCITDHDISHHAEIQALSNAGKTLQNYRLHECDVYVTLEPCAMCASALIQARVKRVIYGAAEAKTGAAGSIIDLFSNRQLNTHTAKMGGILATECQQLLQQFFLQKRKK